MIRWIIVCFVFALLPGSDIHAQVGDNEKVAEKLNIFTARTEGYFHYRVPGMIVTPKGSILAYCEARESHGDWANIDFVLTRSEDGGKTWSKRSVIADAGDRTVNNIVGFSDHQTNTVHFLYCINYSRVFYIKSTDDGKTFSEPREITSSLESLKQHYDWNVIAIGPGHGIQMDNGRLLASLWMSPGELRNDGSRRHRPSAISVIYSDDHGKSWKTGEVIFEDGDMVNEEEVINPSESTVIQLDDGSVMINTRNESEIHRRLTAVSENGMDDWKNKQFHSQLLEPICMGSMVRLTEGETFDKTRMLFVNPNNLFDNDGGKNKIRQNITIKLSYDEGKNWPVSKVIEPGLSGYPDISVGPDHMIYLIYENGGINGNHYDPEHLTFMKLNLEWLTENADSVN